MACLHVNGVFSKRAAKENTMFQRSCSKLLFGAMVLTAAFLLSGCGEVRSLEPIGTQPHNLSKEVKKWEGRWAAPKCEFTITVTDAAKGEILCTASSLPDFLTRRDPESGNSAAPMKIPVQLRDQGEWIMFNVRMDTLSQETKNSGRSGEEPAYFFGRVTNDGDRIIGWVPEYIMFREFVEKGALPGKPDKDTTGVTVGKLSPQQTESICPKEHGGVLYRWDDPGVFFRIGDSQASEPRPAPVAETPASPPRTGLLVEPSASQPSQPKRTPAAKRRR